MKNKFIEFDRSDMTWIFGLVSGICASVLTFVIYHTLIIPYL
jgi:hypothetical protein